LLKGIKKLAANELIKIYSPLLPTLINEISTKAYFQSLITELVDSRRRLHQHVQANITLMNQTKDQLGDIQGNLLHTLNREAPFLYMTIMDANAIRLLQKG
jgi:hypothetical protein